MGRVRFITVLKLRSWGFEYDKNRGAYFQSPVEADRYKMNFDRSSRTIQLSLDSLPPDAPIELSKSKFLCTWLQGFPNQLMCHQGFSHFDFNTENGKFVRSTATAILFHGHPMFLAHGTCDKF